MTKQQLWQRPDLDDDLYLINKQAKSYRDKERESTNKEQKELFKRLKNNLYKLKSDTIKKLLIDGRATISGIHLINNKWYLLVSFGKYTFHTEINDHQKLKHSNNGVKTLDQLPGNFDGIDHFESVQDMAILTYAESRICEYIGIDYDQWCKNNNSC